MHRRTVKKQKKEDAEDPHKSLDFGMVEARLNKSGPKRKSMFGVGEKSNSAKHRQLSMDMNLSSPYLLPPGLQGSRESLHSLARTLHQDEDPYRPVAKYSGDAGSIRSSRRGGEADSMHTGSSKNSGWRSATPVVFPPRQNSLPKPPPPAHQNDPFYKETGLSSQDTHHQNDAFYKETGLSAQDTRSPPVNTPSPPAKDLFASRSASPSPPPQRPAQPDSQQAPMLPYPEDKDSVAMRDLPQLPSIQEPPPVAQVPSRGLPNSPRPGEQSPPQRKPSYDTSMERLPTSPRAGEKSSPQTQRKLSYDASMEMDEFAGRQQTNNEPPRLSDPSTVSSFHHEQQFREPTLPNVSSEPQPPASPPRNSPPSSNSLPANPRPARSLTPPKISPEFPETIPEEPAAPPAGQHSRDTSQNYYDDDYYYGDGQQQANSQHHSEEFPTRGRSLRRQSAEFVGYYDEQQQGGGLAVPQQDVKRLSVGFRPLPPEDIMDLEDPEYRANRIRSFYKEYFDETKQEGFQPPPLPQNNYDFYQNQQQQQYPQQYYEDYDQHYLGEQAHNNQAYYNQPYYDPNAHSFVMPYAQPVQRRAMTPPPSNRMHGPGQRRWHGSVGGMSLPGGRGGPHFRPGSAASSRWGGGHHPMRPGSSISNRYNGGPANKKPMGPPPAPLSTLPNPAKLKDDSFAIMNAIDFAPPDSFSDRVAGRSQSPAGERRPYKPKVPVHLPTVSAFDELATLPSP